MNKGDELQFDYFENSNKLSWRKQVLKYSFVSYAGTILIVYFQKS